jgi:hypothetical protein
MKTPCPESDAADQSSRLAAESSVEANREDKAPLHQAAAARHATAAIAARYAAVQLRSRMLPKEAAEYDDKARHHDNQKAMHERLASLLPASEAGQSETQAVGMDKREDYSALNLITAMAKTAKAASASDPQANRAAVDDAFLHSTEGDTLYRRYVEAIRNGRSGLPKQFAKP